MQPQFDAIDASILAERVSAWNERTGPRVGDFVVMPDKTALRFTHDWGNDIQTTWKKTSGDASFYFSKGCMSFSGSLDSAIPKADLIDTGETREGSAWFFHHNESRAHNGVYFAVPCRVFLYRPKTSADDYGQPGGRTTRLPVTYGTEIPKS